MLFFILSNRYSLYFILSFMLAWTALLIYPLIKMASFPVKSLRRSTVIMLIAVLFECCGIFATNSNNPDFRVFGTIANHGSTISGVLLFYSLARLLYEYIVPNPTKKDIAILLIPVALILILCAINLATKSVFYLDENCKYVSGPLFNLMLGVNQMYAFYIIYFIVKFRKKLKPIVKFIFITIVLIPVVVTLIELLTGLASLMLACLEMALILIYMYLGTTIYTLDTTTKIMNYKTLIKLLNQKDDENKENYTLILVDLNGLEKVNKDFSYSEGNKYLANFAKIAKNDFKDKDFPAYLSQDEFLLYVDEDILKEELQERLLMLETHFRNESMSAGKEYDFTFTYVYDKYSHDKYKNWSDLIDYLYYELNSKKLLMQ